MTSEKCPHCKRRAFFVGEFCAHCRRHRTTGNPGDGREIRARLEKAVLENRQRVQRTQKKLRLTVADPAIQEWLESLWQKPSQPFLAEPLMTAESCPHCGKKTYFTEDYCCQCRCHKASGLPGDPVQTQARIDAAMLKLRQTMGRRMAAAAEAEAQAEERARQLRREKKWGDLF